MSPRAHLYSVRSRRHTSLLSFLQAGSWARATRTATDKPQPPRTNRERGHTGTKGAEADLEQSPNSAVIAAVPDDAVGPRPLPVHRYTVERIVIGRTRKVVEAELEVTFGPLLGSLTIEPFTSCPAGRSPIDRGRSLHRTGRGRIEENVIGYRRGGVRQLDSVAHCPLPNTKAR